MIKPSPQVPAYAEVAVDALNTAGTAGTSVISGSPIAAERRELLPFFREQAITETMHRFSHVRS